MQIVALNGSTAAINEALIGPIRLTPIRYIEKAKTVPITIIPTGYAMIIGGVVLGIIGRVWNISVSLDIYGYLAMAGIIVIGTV